MCLTAGPTQVSWLPACFFPAVCCLPLPVLFRAQVLLVGRIWKEELGPF